MIQRDLGFTLTELILVMIIVGILAGVALPKFFKTLDFSENFYFNDLLASVRYAQKLAIVSGCDTQVLTTGQVVQFKRRANCSTGIFNQDLRNPVNGENTFVKNIPINITLTTTLPDLYFDPLGRAHNTTSGVVSNVVVTLNTRTFNIVGETGLTYEP